MGWAHFLQKWIFNSSFHLFSLEHEVFAMAPAQTALIGMPEYLDESKEGLLFVDAHPLINQAYTKGETVIVHLVPFQAVPKKSPVGPSRIGRAVQSPSKSITNILLAPPLDRKSFSDPEDCGLLEQRPDRKRMQEEQEIGRAHV